MDDFRSFPRTARRRHTGVVLFHVLKVLVALTAFVLLWHEASAL